MNLYSFDHEADVIRLAVQVKIYKIVLNQLDVLRARLTNSSVNTVHPLNVSRHFFNAGLFRPVLHLVEQMVGLQVQHTGCLLGVKFSQRSLPLSGSPRFAVSGVHSENSVVKVWTFWKTFKHSITVIVSQGRSISQPSLFSFQVKLMRRTGRLYVIVIVMHCVGMFHIVYTIYHSWELRSFF